VSAKPIIQTASVLARAPHAAYQVVANEAILINLNSGMTFSLNETGTWLWERLDGATPLAGHAAALADYCQIPDQVALVSADLVDLGQALASEGLVVAQ
jgi:hypothetical protein